MLVLAEKTYGKRHCFRDTSGIIKWALGFPFQEKTRLRRTKQRKFKSEKLSVSLNKILDVTLPEIRENRAFFRPRGQNRVVTNR